MEVNGTEEKGGRVRSPVKGLLSHVQMSIYSFWQNGQLTLARFCKRAVRLWKEISEDILRVYVGRGAKGRGSTESTREQVMERTERWNGRCGGAEAQHGKHGEISLPSTILSAQ